MTNIQSLYGNTRESPNSSKLIGNESRSAMRYSHMIHKSDIQNKEFVDSIHKNVV